MHFSIHLKKRPLILLRNIIYLSDDRYIISFLDILRFICILYMYILVNSEIEFNLLLH